MTHIEARLRARIAALSVLVALSWSIAAEAQQVSAPAISLPAEGQVLLGQVSVKGSTDVPNFSSAELAFAYASEPTTTWFVIQTSSLPVANDVIAVWDTALISDGDYSLRLRVILLDGSFRDAVVKVQVRNYTPTPTASPAVTPTELPAIQIPTAMIIKASETPERLATAAVATPSALPENPAGVTAGEIYTVFWRGALGVGIVILLSGVLVRLRRK